MRTEVVRMRNDSVDGEARGAAPVGHRGKRALSARKLSSGDAIAITHGSWVEEGRQSIT
jgi:hypothetical protein